MSPTAAGTPPTKPEPGGGLSRQIRRGISWNAAGAIASGVVRLAVYVALGRLLSKTEFGIVAAAMTVILFGNTLKDLGIGLALVQRKELEREHVEAAFTFSLLLNSAIGVAIFAGAGWVGEFYHIESSVSIVRLLSLLFVLRGISNVPGFMCRREMRFRALAISDFAGYAVGSVVSVGLAIAGAGAWSLVWGYVVETVVNVALVVYLAPPPLRLRLHRRHLRDLLGFGTGQSGANLAGYFANNGDYMVVGHFLGAAQLGVYQRAYELMRFPATVFTSVAGSVLFSGFAKLQDDPARLGRAFRRILFGCAIVLLPASAGLIVLAPEVVRILLGTRWAGVEQPFQIMAISMLFRTTYKLASQVATASGAAFSLAGWLVVYAACVIGGALFSMRWGILGVSCTTAASVFVVFLAMARLALRATTLRPRDIAAAHAAPLICALVVGGIAWLTASSLRAADAWFPIVAAVTTAVGSLAFVACAWVGIRRGSDDWAWLREMLGNVFGKMTGRRRKSKIDAEPLGERAERPVADDDVVDDRDAQRGADLAHPPG